MYDTLKTSELISKISIRKAPGSLYKPNLSTLFSKNSKFCKHKMSKQVQLIRIKDAKFTHRFMQMTNPREILVMAPTTNCTLQFESTAHLAELLNRCGVYDDYTETKLHNTVKDMTYSVSPNKICVSTIFKI
jgi:hypothetical protein